MPSLWNMEHGYGISEGVAKNFEVDRDVGRKITAELLWNRGTVKLEPVETSHLPSTPREKTLRRHYCQS